MSRRSSSSNSGMNHCGCSYRIPTGLMPGTNDTGPDGIPTAYGWRMKDRMLRGELYIADDPELAADHARAQRLLERYNATLHTEQDVRDRLLRELLGEV